MSYRPQRVTIRQRLIDLKEVEDCLRSFDGSHSDVIDRALARYLVVRAVGYVEAVRDDLADLYAASTGNARLHRRVAHHLRSGQGVAPEQLLTFLGSFDPTWRTTLEATLDADDGKLRSELGAMVAARKKVAHGDGEQVTSGRALAWSAAAREIVKHLTALLDPEFEATS